MLLHELGIVDEDFLKIIVKGSVLDVRHLVVIGVRQSNRVMRSRLRLDDDLLRIWQQNKCTVVFVTHSISESAYLAERVSVLTHTGQLAHIENLSPPASREDFRSSPAFHQAMGNIAAALGHDLSTDLSSSREGGS